MLKTIITLALISLTSTAFAASQKPIKTKEAYVASIADRKATADWGWVMVKSDGTLIGKAFSKGLKGRWYWQDQFWCRVLIEEDGKEGKEDCSLVFLKGRTLYTVSDKGKGSRRELLLP